MLTIEMTQKIKKAYERYPLDETDNDFFFRSHFDELKEGDFVFFPFNVRLGVYRVKKMNYMGIETNGLYRNSSLIPLLTHDNNSGVVLLRVSADLINWDDWEDMESLISINGIEGHRINWDSMHGYSNWYEWKGWMSMFPVDLLRHITKD